MRTPAPLLDADGNEVGVGAKVVAVEVDARAGTRPWMLTQPGEVVGTERGRALVVFPGGSNRAKSVVPRLVRLVAA